MNMEYTALCRETVTENLVTESLGRNIIILSETDSTNNDAKSLASSGAAHGTAVIANTQTNGRGRLGRSFSSPKGCGIYMSVIIRPRFGLDIAPLITSCTAVAVAEAAESLCGRSVDIKWVNDLYMNGRKICGILTEASVNGRNSSLDYAVIGIGINVLSSEDISCGVLRDTATSIEAETGMRIDRNILCARILGRLETQLENIADRRYLREYRRREILTGNIITADTGAGILTGRAVGIDDNACLLVEKDDGTVIAVNSGEANKCRIKE